MPSLADSLVKEASFSPLILDFTEELSIENVPGTISCNAKSSRALSDVLWNISKISYLPGPPPGNTSLPVLICRLRCTTRTTGGRSTVLVATGPKRSILKSERIGAARILFCGEGSGACNGYRITIVLPGLSPSLEEVPTVILKACPGLSGEIIFSSI